MIRIFILMAGLTALFGVLGQWLGGQQGMLLFLGIAVVMNFASYWFSGPMVLKMYKARKISREDAPDLYDMVDRLRQKAGLPMPVVAIAPSDQPNAFATGRNYEHAVVCFTAGLLQLMTREEIEGVAAHELAHIKHRHMLVGTMAATMSGAVAMLASVARWGAILGGGRDADRNPFVLIAMSIVAPMAAMIIQFAISRQNEFQADATAAELTGNPMGLAGGLRRLESAAKRIPMEVNPAAAQLAIVNPLQGGRGMAFAKWFSTHPPTEERISRLEGLVRGGMR
jgi:heat shock protein HtpX